MKRPLWLALVLLVIAAGCSDDPGVPQDAGGELSGHWTGADTSNFSAPALAQWCDSAQALTVMAIRGDTGLAVAIHSRELPKVARYAVRQAPPPGRPVAKPVAGAALRWLGKTRVVGYQADSGTVQLSSIGQVVAGRFDVQLRRAGNDSGEIHLTGRFDKVPLEQGSARCASGVDSTHGTDILP